MNITATNQPLTRRSVLQSAAGLGLSFLMPALDLQAAEKRGSERAKSLLILWMAGGPSQLETWDPHAGSPTGGNAGSISTTLPGADICSLYPQMAEQIGELNIIRSLVSKEGDHERGTVYVKTGYRPDPILEYPAVSAIVARQLTDSQLEIPPHISLGGGQWPARGGYLGASHDAFRIFNPGRHLQNLRAMVGEERQQRRLKSLDVVTSAFARGKRLQVERTLHQRTVDNALKMMSSEQLKAFELDDEPAAVRSAYGDSQFGRGCLVARRLIETGVRAIEVTLTGWDSHASNHEGHVTQAGILDPAFSTLVSDLKQRDLLESTIVLCIGEFGRTPKINPLDGRDHWPNWFSCVVGGGGLAKGLVIGETDPEGQKDATDPIPVNDLYATLLHQLGIDPAEEMMTAIGRPIAFSDGNLITRITTPRA
ncbi:MAG: DUF1501 domain-containing protein [Planctomycetota bacterium]|jgi:hypothetical protein